MTDDKTLVNFGDPSQKRMIKRFIDGLTGIYEFACVRKRDQRSLEQLAWYWSGVLPYVVAGVREEWGEKLFDVNDAHEMCRKRFLLKSWVNRETGEVMEQTVRSTRDLNTEEMAHYIEEIRKHAAEYLGQNIPDPERDPAKRTNPLLDQGPIGEPDARAKRREKVGV